jgi:hypothetical protein
MAADGKDPIQRAAFCPSCGATQTLDEDELVYKRATCAACQNDFELVPELFGRARQGTALVPATAPADSRASATLAVADPPPSRGVATRDDGSIVLRGTLRMPVISPVMGLGIAIVSFLTIGVLSVNFGAAWLPWAAATLAMLVWPWRVRIGVESDALVVARGPLGLWRNRIPLAAVDEVCTGRANRLHLLAGSRRRDVPDRLLRITRVSDYPIEIGARLNRDEQDLKWVERCLTRRIRLARIRASRKRDET